MKNNKIRHIKPNRQPRSRITNEIIFIGLIAFSVIYFLALFTYEPKESTYLNSITLDQPVINQAGVIGAYLGDFSLSIFGFSAYLIPIMFIWWGWRIRKNTGNPKTNRWIILARFIAFVILLLFVSALLSIDTSTSTIGGGTIAGGDVGYSIHQSLVVLFGSSSLVVYLSIIMISFSIVSTLSWSEILNLITKLSKWLFNIIRLGFVAIFSKVKKKSPLLNKKTKSSPAKIIKKTKQITSANVFKTQNDSGLPDLSLLDEININTNGYSKQALEDISRQVEIKLKDFGFDVTTTNVTPGPVVTQFELSLAPGVKVSQIMNLNKDLARALLVESVRIVDVIPGKPVIGLEIPNVTREIIGLKDIFASEVFMQSDKPLTMGLGKDINGNTVIGNLAKMPHLLVAGATGMGKSVGINSIILSILYKSTPDKVRMIMIDPKIVELACYADIPHLLTPVITDMNQAASALWWCVNEMERRYLLLSKFGMRNIEGFNEKLKAAKEKSQPLLDPSFNPKTANEGETAAELECLPLIVLVIDEYADMLGALAQENRTKAKRIEALIVRLAQKARAAGIHLIIATQRPSVDVITGLIKSNVPTRIAFKVSSKVDSRTILDQGGAEQLLGMGDMLYMTPGLSHLIRIHGSFVSDNEITRVVDYLKENSTPNYLDGILNDHSESSDANEAVNNPTNADTDALYDEAVQIVTSTRRASISSLQRRLRIGYNRAARIIEEMETNGVVSNMNNAGNRQVLAPEPINND